MNVLLHYFSTGTEEYRNPALHFYSEIMNGRNYIDELLQNIYTFSFDSFERKLLYLITNNHCIKFIHLYDRKVIDNLKELCLNNLNINNFSYFINIYTLIIINSRGNYGYYLSLFTKYSEFMIKLFLSVISHPECDKNEISTYFYYVIKDINIEEYSDYLHFFSILNDMNFDLTDLEELFNNILNNIPGVIKQIHNNLLFTHIYSLINLIPSELFENIFYITLNIYDDGIIYVSMKKIFEHYIYNFDISDEVVVKFFSACIKNSLKQLEEFENSYFVDCLDFCQILSNKTNITTFINIEDCQTDKRLTLVYFYLLFLNMDNTEISKGTIYYLLKNSLYISREYFLFIYDILVCSITENNSIFSTNDVIEIFMEYLQENYEKRENQSILDKISHIIYLCIISTKDDISIFWEKLAVFLSYKEANEFIIISLNHIFLESDSIQDKIHIILSIINMYVNVRSDFILLDLINSVIIKTKSPEILNTISAERYNHLLNYFINDSSFKRSEYTILLIVKDSELLNLNIVQNSFLTFLNISIKYIQDNSDKDTTFLLPILFNVVGSINLDVNRETEHLLNIVDTFLLLEDPPSQFLNNILDIVNIFHKIDSEYKLKLKKFAMKNFRRNVNLISIISEELDDYNCDILFSLIKDVINPENNILLTDDAFDSFSTICSKIIMLNNDINGEIVLFCIDNVKQNKTFSAIYNSISLFGDLIVSGWLNVNNDLFNEIFSLLTEYFVNSSDLDMITILLYFFNNLIKYYIKIKFEGTLNICKILLDVICRINDTNDEDLVDNIKITLNTISKVLNLPQVLKCKYSINN